VTFPQRLRAGSRDESLRRGGGVGLEEKTVRAEGSLYQRSTGHRGLGLGHCCTTDPRRRRALSRSYGSRRRDRSRLPRQPVSTGWTLVVDPALSRASGVKAAVELNPRPGLCRPLRDVHLVSTCAVEAAPVGSSCRLISPRVVACRHVLHAVRDSESAPERLIGANSGRGVNGVSRSLRSVRTVGRYRPRCGRPNATPRQRRGRHRRQASRRCRSSLLVG
jgi:hypothetical protein